MIEKEKDRLEEWMGTQGEWGVVGMDGRREGGNREELG